MLSISAKKTISLFLLSLLLFSSLSAPLRAAFNHQAAPTGTVITSPCSQQKSVQTQVLKLCTNQLASFSAVAALVFFFLTVAEKIKLLFIVGLLVMNPIYLIFKPPKPQFA